MIETYKILTNTYDPITTKTLMHVVTNTKTRTHTFKLQKDRFKTNKYKFFFTNRVINHWNGLPKHIVTAESLNSFKNRLDKHWEHLKFCTNCANEGVEGRE